MVLVRPGGKLVQGTMKDDLIRDVRKRAPGPQARRRQQALRVQLQALYREVVEEPLPDDLKALLDKLDEPRPRGSGSTD